MPSHVLITGATGFIGSAVLRELSSGGIRVTALLRPDSDTRRLNSIKGWEGLATADLTDPELILSVRESQPDVLIHCGWRGVGGEERNEAFQITENITRTIESVEFAAATGCTQWIGLGSQAEYGNPNQRISEDFPTRPTTTYGKSKLAAGIAALALCESRKLVGAWLRVFSTYGPDDAPNWFIPYVIRQFLTGNPPKLTRCEQQWDYLHVTDAARGIVSVANGTTSGVFNLGSGSSRPLKDYIEAIREEFATVSEPDYGAIPYRPDQVMHLEADISHLIAATGWRPTVSLGAGIKSTVEFYRNQPSP